MDERLGHLAPDERKGLLLHGGTPAQLHLGEQQRFSRDVDLIGHDHGRIEHVLDAIARRYEGRLFRWEETPVEAAEMPLQRFSAYFRNAAGAEIPLKIDVTYLPITLDTGHVRIPRAPPTQAPVVMDHLISAVEAHAPKRLSVLLTGNYDTHWFPVDAEIVMMSNVRELPLKNRLPARRADAFHSAALRHLNSLLLQTSRDV